MRWTLSFLLLLALPAWSATLTVPGDHATPTLAAAATGNGDTVIVSGGPYAGWTESSSSVTWVASGTVNITSGIILSGAGCRLIGFSIDCNYSGAQDAVVLDANNCEVWHCNIREFDRIGIFPDSVNGSIIIGISSFSGTGVVGTDAGDTHSGVNGDDNLVAYWIQEGTGNDFNNYAGDRNRFLNIYSFGASTSGGGHPDQFQTGGNVLGGDFNLFDGMFFVSTGSTQDDHHWYNLESNGSNFDNVLMRRSVVYNTSSGSGVFQEFSYIFHLHNTFAIAQRFPGPPGTGNATVQYALYMDDPTSNIGIRNCIFYEAWGASVTAPRAYLVDSTGFFDHGFNLAWDAETGATGIEGPLATETGAVFEDPLFVNLASHDFRLDTGSPGLNAAGAVTTVSTASGTGTSFDVGIGGYFRGDNTTLSQYSGNLAKGDKITVGTDQLTITTVSGNTITVTASFTWAQNDNVFLGWDSTPNMGAFNGTLLSAATYSGTTVTPNGETRWVVEFVDGIPTRVDDTTPYEFPTPGAGVVTYRAYAMNAQKENLWVNATAANPPAVSTSGSVLTSGSVKLQ